MDLFNWLSADMADIWTYVYGYTQCKGEDLGRGNALWSPISTLLPGKGRDR